MRPFLFKSIVTIALILIAVLAVVISSRMVSQMHIKSTPNFNDITFKRMQMNIPKSSEIIFLSKNKEPEVVEDPQPTQKQKQPRFKAPKTAPIRKSSTKKSTSTADSKSNEAKSAPVPKEQPQIINPFVINRKPRSTSVVPEHPRLRPSTIPKQKNHTRYSNHPICTSRRCITPSPVDYETFHYNPNTPIFKPSLKQFDPSHPIKPIIHTDTPYILKDYEFSYPSFVLPSPLNVEPHKISSYFMNGGFLSSEIRRSRQECNRDSVYLQRETAINYYTAYNCKENPGLCGPVDNYIVYCQHQYRVGHIWVIENGVIPSKGVDCGWGSPYRPMTPATMTPLELSQYTLLKGTYVYLPIPDGWSFQHFVDGVLPKLVQMEELLTKKDIKYIVELDIKRYPIVIKLFERLGISSSQLVQKHKIRMNYFETLIFPCFAPPIHPYLWQRAQYLLKLPHTTHSSLPEPMLVAYLSRGKGTYNGGRKVLNEDEIVSELYEYFNHTSYQVVIFNSNDYKTLDSLFEFWSKVKFVIGPHGGSFSNVVFMRPETVLIEFQFDRTELLTTSYNYRFMFYLQSTMLGLGYHSVLCNTDQVSSEANFACDFDYIRDILDVYVQ